MMEKEFSVAIEADGRRIHLCLGKASSTLRGKASAFFLALITSEYPKFLGRDELHRLAGWTEMTASSVGKQAARIIDTLDQAGLPLIEWQFKTAGWRLRAPIAQFLPVGVIGQAESILAQSAWTNVLRFQSVPAPALAKWMQLCGSALVDMTEGIPGVGYEKLRRAYGISDHEGILAIGDVLATRMGQFLPTPHLPVLAGTETSSFFEVAASVRRLAAYARASPSRDWEYHYNSLRRKLSKILESGDTTSQAILFNALAILARRLGRMDDALENIKEAAALSLFSGDLILIQNVSFNFGNILSSVSRLDPSEVSSDDYMALIELDIEIRSRLNVGMDSAQAELLSAYLFYEHGKIGQANEQLTKAQRIISISRQEHDIALYDRMKGLLTCASSDPGSPEFEEGCEAMLLAIGKYEAIGNTIAADEAKGELAAQRALVCSDTANSS